MGPVARAYESQGSPADAPPLLRVHLLGGFRVVREGGVPPAERWPRPSARTLVKLLALAPGHQLHREHLMAVCWPYAELAAALRSLRVALHAARHALEPELRPRAASSYLIGDGALLRLAPHAVWVDTDHAVARAEHALDGGTVPELAAALDLFGGELLPEDTYAPWAEPHRTRLAHLRDRLRPALAEAQLAAGETDQAAATARRALEDTPADERVHRILMDAYLRQGLCQKAVRQYRACAAALRAGPGTAPGPRTERLHRAALQGGPGRALPSGGAEDDAARVRLEWAQSLDRAGRYEEAVRVLREALASYELQGRADACALAAARLAEVLARARPAREAHEALEAHPPGPGAAPDVAAAHHMARAMVLFYTGEYAPALAAARTAQRAAEAVPEPGCPAVLARSFAQQAVCLGLLGDPAAAMGPAERALGPAERSGDPALLAHVLSVLRENARRAGRHRQALEHGRRALALAEQAGRPTATAFERANLAELHLLLGEMPEAERLATAATELAEPFGGTALAFALVALARVRTAGEPAAAAALLDRAERCARDGGHCQAMEEVRTARAELHAGLPPATRH